LYSFFQNDRGSVAALTYKFIFLEDGSEDEAAAEPAKEVAVAEAPFEQLMADEPAKSGENLA
jgi:hypothetical protein